MKIGEKITEMSARLAPVNKEVEQWMLSNMKPIAYEFHGHVVCTECGHDFNTETMNIDGTIACPKCGKVLQVEHTTKKSYSNSCFMMITQEYEGWQVFRYYWVTKEYAYNSYRNEYWAYQGCFEVMQKWLSQTGDAQYMARKLKMFPARAYNPFKLDSDLRFRRKVTDNYCYYDPTDLSYKYMKVLSLTKWMKQIGFNKTRSNNQQHGFWIDDFAPAVIKEPLYEILYKSKKYNVIRYLNKKRFFKYGDDAIVSKRRDALRIAMRHKYLDELLSGKKNEKQVEAAISDWVDLIDQIIKLGLDYRNPHYVCPKDLWGDHVHYTKKLNEIKEEEERIKDLGRAKDMEASYIEARKCYFPLEIKDDVLTIKVLPNVQSFADEGEKLKHCVFGSEYFNMKRNPDSLILSARIGEDWEHPDEYVETIEVNLTDYSIVQSRGRMNLPSKYHSRIMRLLYSNIDKIMECEKEGEKAKNDKKNAA